MIKFFTTFKKPVLAIAIVSITLSLTSCKKVDFQSSNQSNKDDRVEQFLKLPVESSKILEKISNQLLKLELKNSFVSSKLMKCGELKWKESFYNKLDVVSLISNGSEEELSILVPLANYAEHRITSFLACKVVGDSISILLYEGHNYKNYGYNSVTSPNANSITRTMMAMEYEVYGTSKFIINDTSLSFYKPKPVNGYNFLTLRPKANGSTNFWFSETTCYEEQTWYDDGYGNLTLLQDWTEVCTTQTVWVEIIGGGGVGGGGGSGNPGNGWPFDPNSGGGIGGGGSSGGGPSGSGGINQGYSTIPEAVSTFLSLNVNQESLLQTHTYLADELFGFLTNNYDPESKERCIEHINMCLTDVSYLNFSVNHALGVSSGEVWWMDELWLQDSNNFALSPLSNPQVFDDLTPAELALIGTFPIQAFQIKLNVDEAFAEANNIYQSEGALNGKQDAFRHAFFQAINVRDVTASN